MNRIHIYLFAVSYGFGTFEAGTEEIRVDSANAAEAWLVAANRANRMASHSIRSLTLVSVEHRDIFQPLTPEQVDAEYELFMDNEADPRESAK